MVTVRVSGVVRECVVVAPRKQVDAVVVIRYGVIYKFIGSTSF